MSTSARSKLFASQFLLLFFLQMMQLCESFKHEEENVPFEEVWWGHKFLWLWVITFWIQGFYWIILNFMILRCYMLQWFINTFTLYKSFLWSRCLQSVIESYGTKFNDHVDENLVRLIAACLDNNSRFVRETACLLHGAIIATNFAPGQFESVSTMYSIIHYQCSLLQKTYLFRHGWVLTGWPESDWLRPTWRHRNTI